MHYYGNGISDVFADTDQMFGFEDEYSPTSKALAKGQNKIGHGVDWDEWASLSSQRRNSIREDWI